MLLIVAYLSTVTDVKHSPERDPQEEDGNHNGNGKSKALVINFFFMLIHLAI